jgi:hypothetical protein
MQQRRRGPARWRWLLFATLATFAACGVAAAQQDPGFPVTALELAPLEAPYTGTLARVDGQVAAGEEDHFTVANLSIFQPAAVHVVAMDPARPVTLRLGKVEWKENVGGGSTDAEGGFVAKFRTQGDLLLSVSAPNGGDYRLMVWAGPEAPPPMEPILVPADEADAMPWWRSKLLLGVLAVLVVGGLGWLLGRRKGRAS